VSLIPDNNKAKYPCSCLGCSLLFDHSYSCPLLMKGNCYSGLIDCPVPDFWTRNMGNMERLSTAEDVWCMESFFSFLSNLSLDEKIWGVERLSSGLHGHPPSLKQLYFVSSLNFGYLPEDGFPPSLKVFRIIQCEILKDGSSLFGNYWHLIQEIPLIVIDLVWIQ